MIAALDSAYAPSASAATAARAAGVCLWNGYAATRAGVGIYHAWSQADFDNARLCGGQPIAYCSGWDDPVALRALAAEWRVRLCVDVEAGIRDDGPWVQGFLDASGAGLYGNLRIHLGRRAPFHVLSWYVSDPGATWGGSAPPGTPCGWQWQNSHDEFGVTVDRCWFDDWFKQEGSFMALTDQQQQDLYNMVGALWHDGHDAPYVSAHGANVSDIVAAIAVQVKAEAGLLAAVKAELDTLKMSSDPAVASSVARIEAALKQA